MNCYTCRSTVRPDRPLCCALVLLILSCAGNNAAAQDVITRGSRLSLDVSPQSEQLAIELSGGIWLLPRTGGPANLLAKTLLPASQPRWSPDGREVLFESGAGSVSRLWRVDLQSREPRRIVDDEHYNTDASWHPDGNRIVFSSNRAGGLDLWEYDLRNDLAWRLTHHQGDESDPAWSADGRDLAYVLAEHDEWRLMLRRFGEPDAVLLRSATRLATPSWRPDGTLISYLQHSDQGVELRMTILSNPPLHRQLAPADAFAPTPVAWLDRSRLYYSAGGRIKTRRFDDWSANTVAFRATVKKPPPRPELHIANRDLPIITPPDNNLVIRSGRVFDGLSRDYRQGLDVRLENGLIAEVTTRRDWGDLPIIDLAGTTLMPGLIDAYGRLQDSPSEAQGAALLSWGVTTIVSPQVDANDALRWAGEDSPGPRLLRARRVPAEEEPQVIADPSVYLWTIAPEIDAAQPEAAALAALQMSGRPVMAEDGGTGLALQAAVILGTDLLAPRPPGGAGFAHWPAADRPPALMVSGLARRDDPNSKALFAARQARGLAGPAPPPTRPAALPDLRAAGSRLIAGSRPSGLPPGLALHAELRQMAAAGLPGPDVLQAAGYNAAKLLGLTGQLGEISAGARADLLLVNGDPLHNVEDLQNIAAVVRNGRFYSVVALLEEASTTVE